MRLRAERLYVDKETGEMGLAFQDSDDGAPVHKVYFNESGIKSFLGCEDKLRPATHREEQTWYEKDGKMENVKTSNLSIITNQRAKWNTPPSLKVTS